MSVRFWVVASIVYIRGAARRAFSELNCPKVQVKESSIFVHFLFEASFCSFGVIDGSWSQSCRTFASENINAKLFQVKQRFPEQRT